MNPYYAIAQFIATEIIDVDLSCDYINGAVEIDLKVRIPIATSIEKTCKELLESK
jgi:hypothetical protein